MEYASRRHWFGRVWQLIRHLTSLQIPSHAAHAGYFIVLSLFPALVLLLALLRYTGLPVDNLTEMLEGIIPAALMPYAKRLILNTYQNTSGTLVGISAVTTLWSASRGIHGMISGLRAVYHVPQKGGYLHRRLVSIGYTFAFLLVLVLTLLLQVFGNSLLRILPVTNTPFYRFLTDVVDLRFFVLLAMQTILFTVIFYALPGRKIRLKHALPGALLASAGWLSFSNLYSIYVAHFTGYSSIYGSVYTVALSMLWLYCCLSILFYGGALNYYLLETVEKP